MEHTRHPYLTKLLTTIRVAGARAGMNSMTFIDRPFDRLDAHTVADGRVEGVVLFGLPTDIAGAHEWIRELEKMGLPLVDIGSNHNRYQVHAGNFGGAKLAARHLIGLGHRCIGYLQSPVQSVSIKPARKAFYR